MAQRRILVALALAALPACRDVSGAPAGAPGLADRRAWAGGSLRIAANGLPFDSALTVVTGADTVPVTQGDSTTFLATLPDTNGPIAITLLSRGRSIPLGTIDVAGFSGDRAGPAGAGYPLRQPGGRAQVIVHGASGIELVDLATGGTQTLVKGVSSAQCTRGVGQTPIPGGMVLDTSSACGLLRAYSRSGIGTVASIDSGPHSSFWPAAYLGNGVWVRSIKHSIDTWQRLPNGTLVSILSLLPYEQPWQFVVSPAGDRALPTGYEWVTPVFDGSSGQVAYTLPFRVGGAAFSDAGDSLFLATKDTSGTRWLRVVRPVDGAVLATVSLPGFGQDLSLDPMGRWIYVVGARTTGDPVVWVYDRGTLAFVAGLGTRPLGGVSDQFFGSVAIPDPLAHQLYVYELFSIDAPVPSVIHIYNVLP